METSETEGRTFMQAISEKYSPENFPCRRGPGLGVVVVPSGPQGSPMKGEAWVNKNQFMEGSFLGDFSVCFGSCFLLLCFILH